MNLAIAKKLSAPVLQRAYGEARVGTKQRSGTTRLDTLYQHGSGKIRLPNTHSPALEAVFINTAGGITGGDDFRWGADVAAGGHLVVTTQACERIYRSTGDTATIRTQLKVGAGAHLDWLPQETILYDASRLHRHLEADLEANATLTAIEAVLLGRDAMGEDAYDALLRDNWRIRRNGRLIHAEATTLYARPSERSSASLLDGNRAFATILHVAADGADADAMHGRIQTIIPQSSTIGSSVVGERLVVRAIAPSGLALRRMIVPILRQLSSAGTLPRLWHL